MYEIITLCSRTSTTLDVLPSFYLLDVLPAFLDVEGHSRKPMDQLVGHSGPQGEMSREFLKLIWN